MESILTSIKKLLGVDEFDESFDGDIIIHINSAFFRLSRLGVGPSVPFFINSKESIWTDFLQDIDAIALVKTYVYLKVKLVFDPPASSFAIDAINKQITEYEWSLNEAVESTPTAAPEPDINARRMVLGEADKGEYLEIDNVTHNVQNIVDTDKELISTNYSYELE